jgi:hypothetical protein
MRGSHNSGPNSVSLTKKKIRAQLIPASHPRGPISAFSSAWSPGQPALLLLPCLSCAFALHCLSYYTTATSVLLLLLLLLLLPPTGLLYARDFTSPVDASSLADTVATLPLQIPEASPLFSSGAVADHDNRHPPRTTGIIVERMAAGRELDVYAAPYIPLILKQVNTAPAHHIACQFPPWTDFDAYVAAFAGSFLAARPRPSLAIPAPGRTSTSPNGRRDGLDVLAEKSYAAFFSVALEAEILALQSECEKSNLYQVPLSQQVRSMFRFACAPAWGRKKVETLTLRRAPERSSTQCTDSSSLDSVKALSLLRSETSSAYDSWSMA